MTKQSNTTRYPSLSQTIPKIAEFVMPVARAAKRKEFAHDWKSGVGWQPELKIDFDLLARQQQKQFLLADDAKKNRLSQDRR